jgi:predicted nucleic acid-binding protein
LRAAFDTNVLAYAEGIDEPERKTQALSFIRSFPPDRFAVPVQVLGELFNVLVRKARFDRAVARAVVLTWRDSYPVLETSQTVMSRAVGLAADHGLGIWDSVIVCAASEGRCDLLLSEDMQDGFTWGGVTVINPFASTPHRLLRDLQDGA